MIHCIIKLALEAATSVTFFVLSKGLPRDVDRYFKAHIMAAAGSLSRTPLVESTTCELVLPTRPLWELETLAVQTFPMDLYSMLALEASLAGGDISGVAALPDLLEASLCASEILRAARGRTASTHAYGATTASRGTDAPSVLERRLKLRPSAEGYQCVIHLYNRVFWLLHDTIMSGSKGEPEGSPFSKGPQLSPIFLLDLLVRGANASELHTWSYGIYALETDALLKLSEELLSLLDSSSGPGARRRGILPEVALEIKRYVQRLSSAVTTFREGSEGSSQLGPTVGPLSPHAKEHAKAALCNIIFNSVTGGVFSPILSCGLRAVLDGKKDEGQWGAYGDPSLFLVLLTRPRLPQFLGSLMVGATGSYFSSPGPISILAAIILQMPLQVPLARVFSAYRRALPPKSSKRIRPSAGTGDSQDESEATAVRALAEQYIAEFERGVSIFVRMGVLRVSFAKGVIYLEVQV